MGTWTSFSFSRPARPPGRRRHEPFRLDSQTADSPWPAPMRSAARPGHAVCQRAHETKSATAADPEVSVALVDRPASSLTATRGDTRRSRTQQIPEVDLRPAPKSPRPTLVATDTRPGLTATAISWWRTIRRVPWD